jgi:hypothetical protein
LSIIEGEWAVSRPCHFTSPANEAPLPIEKEAWCGLDIERRNVCRVFGFHFLHFAIDCIFKEDFNLEMTELYKRSALRAIFATETSPIESIVN